MAPRDFPFDSRSTTVKPRFSSSSPCILYVLRATFPAWFSFSHRFLAECVASTQTHTPTHTHHSKENEQLFLRTLYGIMKNIGQLCNRQNSSWGRDGWKRVSLKIFRLSVLTLPRVTTHLVHRYKFELTSCSRCIPHQVVVCIVADGRTKIHPKVLDVLTILGVYRDGNFCSFLFGTCPLIRCRSDNPIPLTPPPLPLTFDLSS